VSRSGDEVAVAPVAGRRSAPRRGWGGPLVTVTEPALVVVAVLAVWEVLARAGVLPSSVPAPGAIVSSLASDVQTSRLWDGVLASVGAWAVGLGIVVVIGVPVGVILGSSRVLYAATRHTVEFLRMIPSIAALPLLILVYGIGFKLTVVLVVLTALWPLLLQSMYGVHDVDPVARDTARVYGLGRGRVFSRVIVPSVAPYVATGLRLSGTIALVVAIATSLVVGGSGLGALIASASNSGQNTLMYGRILLAGILGLILTGALIALERRLLHWHPSQRQVSS
jgi:NitT/TauT family transport system permease protein